MSVIQRVARGQGPFWATVKRVAKFILHFHIPASGIARPLFAGCYWIHVSGREGLAWVLRFFWYEPLFRSQCRQVGSCFRMEQLPYLTGKGDITVGSRVRLSGKPSFAFSNRHHQRPEIIIGDNSFIGHECALIASQKIQIGNDTLIARGVRILDHDGHPIDAARRRAGEPEPADCVESVLIGNDVWIGEGAVILKGVRIGDRAIVGGRSVVTRSVESDTIVAGNPARVVKNLPEDHVPHAA